MANNNPSRIWTWLLIALGVGGILLLLIYFVFPELIAKLTGLIVGLFAVATGLIFRRKK